MKLSSQSLQIVEMFCYLGVTTEAKEGAVGRVITRIRSGWSKFRDFLPLSRSRGLSLGAKGRLHFACMYIVMLSGSEVWSAKKQDVIRLLRNDASIVR